VKVALHLAEQRGGAGRRTAADAIGALAAFASAVFDPEAFGRMLHVGQTCWKELPGSECRPWCGLPGALAIPLTQGGLKRRS
jgi:hypothetical protein